MQFMKITYFIYLLAVSWQDLKSRKIPVWIFICFGAVGILENILWKENGWMEAASALLPGFLLLILTRCSRGAIGAGDGYFFLVSAVYLGFWNTAALLFYGLLFCSAFCMGIVVWGVISNVSVRKLRLPFLPFLLPAWAWVMFL